MHRKRTRFTVSFYSQIKHYFVVFSLQFLILAFSSPGTPSSKSSALSNSRPTRSHTLHFSTKTNSNCLSIVQSGQVITTSNETLNWFWCNVRSSRVSTVIRRLPNRCYYWNNVFRLWKFFLVFRGCCVWENQTEEITSPIIKCNKNLNFP